VPPFPRASAAEVLRALATIGFAKVGQKGSPIKLRDAVGRVVIVPERGSESLQIGTLKSILRQAGISAEEFSTLLR
jgi:predicted RNA binding protein YcfA (HicA-like mRNA interferase family)